MGRAADPHPPIAPGLDAPPSSSRSPGSTKKRRPDQGLPCTSFSFYFRDLLLSAQAPRVGDRLPGLFVVDHGRVVRDHAGALAAVLDHPEHLTGRAHLVELRIGEVPRRRVERGAGGAVALPGVTVARKTRSLALENRLALGEHIPPRPPGVPHFPGL